MEPIQFIYFAFSSSIALLIGTCAAFFVIVADLAPMVVAWLTNVPASSQLRLVVLFALGAFVVFPLTLIRNLDSLSKISAVSMCFYIWLTAQVNSINNDPCY